METLTKINLTSNSCQKGINQHPPDSVSINCFETTSLHPQKLVKNVLWNDYSILEILQETSAPLSDKLISPCASSKCSAEIHRCKNYLNGILHCQYFKLYPIIEFVSYSPSHQLLGQAICNDLFCHSFIEETLPFSAKRVPFPILMKGTLPDIKLRNDSCTRYLHQYHPFSITIKSYVSTSTCPQQLLKHYNDYPIAPVVQKTSAFVSNKIFFPHIFSKCFAEMCLNSNFCNSLMNFHSLTLFPIVHFTTHSVSLHRAAENCLSRELFYLILNEEINAFNSKNVSSRIAAKKTTAKINLRNDSYERYINQYLSDSISINSFVYEPPQQSVTCANYHNFIEDTITHPKDTTFSPVPIGVSTSEINLLNKYCEIFLNQSQSDGISIKLFEATVSRKAVFKVTLSQDFSNIIFIQKTDALHSNNMFFPNASILQFANIKFWNYCYKSVLHYEATEMYPIMLFDRTSSHCHLPELNTVNDVLTHRLLEDGNKLNLDNVFFPVCTIATTLNLRLSNNWISADKISRCCWSIVCDDNHKQGNVFASYLKDKKSFVNVKHSTHSRLVSYSQYKVMTRYESFLPFQEEFEYTDETTTKANQLTTFHFPCAKLTILDHLLDPNEFQSPSIPSLMKYLSRNRYLEVFHWANLVAVFDGQDNNFLIIEQSTPFNFEDNIWKKSICDLKFASKPQHASNLKFTVVHSSDPCLSDVVKELCNMLPGADQIIRYSDASKSTGCHVYNISLTTINVDYLHERYLHNVRKHKFSQKFSLIKCEDAILSFYFLSPGLHNDSSSMINYWKDIKTLRESQTSFVKTVSMDVQYSPTPLYKKNVSPRIIQLANWALNGVDSCSDKRTLLHDSSERNDESNLEEWHDSLIQGNVERVNTMKRIEQSFTLYCPSKLEYFVNYMDDDLKSKWPRNKTLQTTRKKLCFSNNSIDNIYKNKELQRKKDDLIVNEHMSGAMCKNITIEEAQDGSKKCTFLLQNKLYFDTSRHKISPPAIEVQLTAITFRECSNNIPRSNLNIIKKDHHFKTRSSCLQGVSQFQMKNPRLARDFNFLRAYSDNHTNSDHCSAQRRLQLKAFDTHLLTGKKEIENICSNRLTDAILSFYFAYPGYYDDVLFEIQSKPQLTVKPSGDYRTLCNDLIQTRSYWKKQCSERTSSRRSSDLTICRGGKFDQLCAYDNTEKNVLYLKDSLTSFFYDTVCKSTDSYLDHLTKRNEYYRRREPQYFTKTLNSISTSRVSNILLKESIVFKGTEKEQVLQHSKNLLPFQLLTGGNKKSSNIKTNKEAWRRKFTRNINSISNNNNQSHDVILVLYMNDYFSRVLKQHSILINKQKRRNRLINIECTPRSVMEYHGYSYKELPQIPPSNCAFQKEPYYHRDYWQKWKFQKNMKYFQNRGESGNVRNCRYIVDISERQNVVCPRDKVREISYNKKEIDTIKATRDTESSISWTVIDNQKLNSLNKLENELWLQQSSNHRHSPWNEIKSRKANCISHIALLSDMTPYLGSNLKSEVAKNAAMEEEDSIIRFYFCSEYLWKYFLLKVKKGNIREIMEKELQSKRITNNENIMTIEERPKPLLKFNNNENMKENESDSKNAMSPSTISSKNNQTVVEEQVIKRNETTKESTSDVTSLNTMNKIFKKIVDNPSIDLEIKETRINSLTSSLKSKSMPEEDSGKKKQVIHKGTVTDDLKGFKWLRKYYRKEEKVSVTKKTVSSSVTTIKRNNTRQLSRRMEHNGVELNERSNTEMADNNSRLPHHSNNSIKTNKNHLGLHSMGKELKRNDIKPDIQCIYETSL